jgi:hypothetical protein
VKPHSGRVEHTIEVLEISSPPKDKTNKDYKKVNIV